jgi:hypothetical protein
VNHNFKTIFVHVIQIATPGGNRPVGRPIPKPGKQRKIQKNDLK